MAGSVLRGGSTRAPSGVTIVVPTFNEADRLPVLLAHLDAQTVAPDEIIVADACSSDDTRAIATAHGARVVEGGMPGPGRNAGAKAARSELILFMDADAEPAPEFLERAVAEFRRRGLDVATAPLRGTEGGWEFSFWFAVAEAYMRVLQRVAPHAVGVCILVRKGLHDRIGGFDESVVLAEDHEYARRASHAGRFGVLRSVKIPASMRRMHKEGRLHMARVFWFSEVRTLAGIPIRSIPFAYEFGVFEGGGIARVPRARLLIRELAKPSTELQTDALGMQVAAMGVSAAALASAGMGGAGYLPVAGVAATVAALSAYEVARKLRFEKAYGDFFIASVAIASADIRNGEGNTIVHKGVDEIAELHAIGHLTKMSELNKQGVAGRLTIMLGALEGLRAMMDDMDDPAFHKVSYVTARSDLTVLLFKMGFEEVEDPPSYDLVNKTEKRAFMWLVAKRIGRRRPGDVESYRMAIASRDQFTGERLKAAVDAQIERVRRDLDKALEAQRAG